MPIEVNQTESTRNQSTARYEQKVIFLFDNRYQEEVCWNESGLTLPVGTVIKRINDTFSGNLPYGVPNCAPVTDFEGENQNLIIGVLATEFEGTSKPVNICVKGTVSSNHILADLEQVNTASGLKLRDVLEKLGLHLQSSVEHTKFDN